MECFTCHDRMECVDDINEAVVRLDLLRCKRCGSEATVTYGQNGKYIAKVEWSRDPVKTKK